jgi:SAM-dependent methyltransferase
VQRLKRWLMAARRALPWRALDRWLAYSERRRLLDRTLEKQRGWMKGRVLEIGAGQHGRRGRFVPPVSGAACWWAVDLNRANQPHVSADIARLPFSDRAFDTVVCLEVLEYVPDLQVTLTEVARVMSAESALILAVPFNHRADHPSDRWRLTERGLRDIMETAGYVVDCVERQGTGFLVIGSILKFAAHTVHPGWLRLLLGALVWPLIMALRGLDEPTARWLPPLRDYSTGYLVRVRPR